MADSNADGTGNELTTARVNTNEEKREQSFAHDVRGDRTYKSLTVI